MFTFEGVKEGKVTCCGSGPFIGILFVPKTVQILSCGGRRGVKEFRECENVREYVFFDFSHPTERANKQLAQLSWSGNSGVKGSFNLKALFESY